MNQALREMGKALAKARYVYASAGNVSMRHEGETMLITASGSDLASLQLDDVGICSFDGTWRGRRKPSKEWRMHGVCYETWADVGAVIHATPFYATWLGCMKEHDDLSRLFVEAMYYLRRIERVPYLDPGSEELAEAVGEAIRKGTILLLENHGVLIAETSLKEAWAALEALEMAAKMVVLAQVSGATVNHVDEAKQEAFLRSERYKPAHPIHQQMEGGR